MTQATDAARMQRAAAVEDSRGGARGWRRRQGDGGPPAQVGVAREDFERVTGCVGDLSRWDVSNVTDMNFMLCNAPSFTHQLGGAWSTSTANKFMMFYNCPGSIAGKTKEADGTIQ